jgi:hypothetical protein
VRAEAPRRTPPGLSALRSPSTAFLLTVMPTFCFRFWWVTTNQLGGSKYIVCSRSTRVGYKLLGTSVSVSRETRGGKLLVYRKWYYLAKRQRRKHYNAVPNDQEETSMWGHTTGAKFRYVTNWKKKR